MGLTLSISTVLSVKSIPQGTRAKGPMLVTSGNEVVRVLSINDLGYDGCVLLGLAPTVSNIQGF